MKTKLHFPHFQPERELQEWSQDNGKSMCVCGCNMGIHFTTSNWKSPLPSCGSTWRNRNDDDDDTDESAEQGKYIAIKSLSDQLDFDPTIELNFMSLLPKLKPFTFHSFGQCYCPWLIFVVSRLIALTLPSTLCFAMFPFCLHGQQLNKNVHIDVMKG